jgi:proteasome assembly chaperone (PAC2) family protein
MVEESKLNKPWLVAVWPGMGHVAISAGYYLMAKLGMHVLAEFSPRGLFEVDHVEIKKGLIHTGRLPRSRIFVWRNPGGEHDIIVFIGEAQPPTGKYAFCQKLIEFAQEQGVERVFTFGAMATRMQPAEPSRVFAAATDLVSLSELQKLDLSILQEGHISGLNGVLLGVAADHGLSGYSLLGEMPHVFAQLPFPKASLAVLKTFTRFAGITLDFQELTEQAEAMEHQLEEILAKLEQAMAEQAQQAGEGAESDEEEESFAVPEAEPRLSAEDEARIERLFAQARENRSKAYELKGLLDKLDVFKDFEDRFLDLFKQPG